MKLLFVLVVVLSTTTTTCLSLPSTGDGLSSVLGRVEQLLAQSEVGVGDSDDSSSIDANLERSAATRELLKKFENSIIAQLNEGNTQAVAVRWNNTISPKQSKVHELEAQLTTLAAAIATTNQEVSRLQSSKGNLTKQIETTRRELSSNENSYHTTREFLAKQQQVHIDPSLVIADRISGHLASVFSRVPDVDDMAPVLLLQIDDQASNNCGSILEAIQNQNENERILAGAAEGQTLSHVTVVLPVAPKHFDHNLILSLVTARAVASFVNDICEGTTLTHFNTQTKNNNNNNNNQQTTLRVTTTTPLRCAVKVREQVQLQRESLAAKIDKELWASPIPSVVVSHVTQALDVRSVVSVSAVFVTPGHLSEEVIQGMKADPDFCDTLTKLTVPVADQKITTTRFDLGVRVSRDQISDTTAAFQKIADVLHFPATVSVTQQALSDFIETRQSAVPGHPRELSSAENPEICATVCSNRAWCFSFTVQNGQCALFDSRVDTRLQIPDGVVVHALRLNSKVLDNFETKLSPTVGGRQHNAVRLAGLTQEECAVTCLRAAKCEGFSFENSECVLGETNKTISFHATTRPTHTRLTVALSLSVGPDFSHTIQPFCQPHTWTSVLSVLEQGHVIVDEVRRVEGVDVGGVVVEQSLCRAVVVEAPTQTEDKYSGMSDLTQAVDDGPKPERGYSWVNVVFSLPLEHHENWGRDHVTMLVKAIAQALGLPLSAVTVLSTSAGSVKVEVQINVEASAATELSETLERQTSDGSLAASLTANGVAVAYVGLAQSPKIAFDCSDVFVPVVGELTCNSETIITGPSSIVSLPCDCAHHAAMNGMGHFVFDVVSGECNTFSKNVSINGVDTWYERHCTADVNVANTFSGNIIQAYLNQYTRQAGVKVNTLATQTRANELDSECCARQCSLRSWCAAFSWREETHLCFLHAAVNSTQLAASTGTDFYNYTGYDETRVLTRTQTENQLLELTSALSAQLIDVRTYVNEELAKLDDDFETTQARLRDNLQSFQDHLVLVVDGLSSALASQTELAGQRGNIESQLSTLETEIASNIVSRDTEVSNAGGMVEQWQSELETIRELRRLLENLLIVDSETDRQRAVNWLRTREDVSTSDKLFTPFHDVPTQLYTADGLPRNRIDPDGTRFTELIPCAGASRSAFFSLMLEANVTYTFNLFLKGYTLSDAVFLIRNAPGLTVMADHLDYNVPTSATMLNQHNSGVSNIADALPDSQLSWKCEHSGWYVMQVTALNATSCGLFAVSAESDEPPFTLVVDGKEREGALSCANHKDNIPTTFHFQAVQGVSYRVRTLSKDPNPFLGSVAFIRDSSHLSSTVAGTTSMTQALGDSTIVWTCTHSGEYEVVVTSTSTHCGTFGVKIETLQACLGNPCPSRTVCVDDVVPGQFICRQPTSTEHLEEEPVVEVSLYGFDMTLWFDSVYSADWQLSYQRHLTSALSSSLNTPSANIVFNAVGAQSGGVAVSFHLNCATKTEAKAKATAALVAVSEGTLLLELTNQSVPVASVWDLALNLRDSDSSNRTLSCSPDDLCRGCNQLSTGWQTWDNLPLNRTCRLSPDSGRCVDVNSRSCRHSEELIFTSAHVNQQPLDAQPQVLYKIRMQKTGGAVSDQQFQETAIQSAIWWTHVADPTQVAVLDFDSSTGTVFLTFVVGVSSRQTGVETLRLLDVAVANGSLLRHMQAKLPVDNLMVVKSHLTSAMKTGVLVRRFPQAGSAQKCDRIVLDTGGCDTDFNLAAPYAQNNKQHIPTADGGSVAIPEPCVIGNDFVSVDFPASKHGAVVFLDTRFVDVERTVPHLLGALPQQIAPFTGIAQTNSVEEWRAALQGKAWLVVPKLKGSIDSPLTSDQMAVVKEFVGAGGTLLVTGTPTRSSQLINNVFDLSVEDLSLAEGGLSFLPGTNTLKLASDDLSTTSVAQCTTQWTDQNAFSFVDASSLPSEARILYRDGKKVGMFDLTHLLGRIVFIAFDFYDIPSADTACVLRNTLAIQS